MQKKVDTSSARWSLSGTGGVILPIGAVVGLLLAFTSIAIEVYAHHSRIDKVTRSLTQFSAATSSALALSGEVQLLVQQFDLLREPGLVGQLEKMHGELNLQIEQLETMPSHGVLAVGFLPRLRSRATETSAVLGELDVLRDRLGYVVASALLMRDQHQLHGTALRGTATRLWFVLAVSAVVATLSLWVRLREGSRSSGLTSAAAALLARGDADVRPVIEAARADERARIGRNLHDELGALLMSLKITLKRSSKFNGQARRAVDSQWTVMLERVDAAMRAVTDIAGALRPCVVDQVGFRAATESYVQWFENVSGIPCNLQIDGESLPLAGEVADEVFRVIQEVLTNVARHAEASNIDIRVGVEHGRVTVRIADDGKGISPDAVLSPQSHGIAGMFERARGFGGELHINGKPSAGTSVTLQLPVMS